MVMDSSVQPSEMDRMVFYRLEQLVDDIQEIHQEREEARKKQESKEKGNSPNFDFNSIKRQASSNLPKIPSSPQLPKFKL